MKNKKDKMNKNIIYIYIYKWLKEVWWEEKEISVGGESANR